MTRRIILVDIGAGLTLRGMLPSVALFTAYSATLKAAGGQAPYTYTLSAGALPTGLYLDSATGVISGSASAAGTASFTVRATDLTGAYVDRAFWISVIAEPLSLSGAAPAWNVGTPYSYSYTAANGVPPYTWSLAAGALPAGLALDAGTGTISGTPTAPNAPAWTVRVTDSAGTSIDLRDNVTLQLLGAFAAATVGTAYSSDLPINGGDLPYSNPRVIAGSLPAGVTSLSIVDDKLRLSGTPTAAATSNFTVAVDSGDGETATSAQSVVVSAAQGIIDSLASMPSAAYSLRRLLSAYSGPCIRVVRSTDSAELDIGFDTSGNFDSSGLSSFIGSASAQVIKFYDQSGNDLHIQTTSGGTRPDIVVSGVTQTLNSKTILNFRTSCFFDNAAGSLASTSGWTANAVAKPSVYTTAQQSVFDQDNYPTSSQRIAQYLRFAYAGVEGVAYNTSSGIFTATSPSNSPTIITSICTTTSVTSFADGYGGTSIAVSGTLRTGAYPFRMGRSLVNGGAIPFTGKIAEVIIFPAPLSTADRHTLERDQGTYYGVTVG